MIWLYRFLFPLLFVLALPFYLLRMIRRGGYAQMMAGRFGSINIPPKQEGKRRIWIQAVSVGELLAIESILEALSRDKSIEIVLTTTTSTGFELAKDKYGEKCLSVSSFPLDFIAFSSRTWTRVNPDIAIITEGELWPEHIYQAKQRHVPLVLINARLSDKSFKRMKQFRALQSLFYQQITRIGASSKRDAQRMMELGYPSEQIEISGNLKFDVVDPEGMNEADASAFLKTVSVGQCNWNDQPCRMILGASTWPGEEERLIEAALELVRSGLPVRLLLVPRHAERRSEIKSLLRRYETVSWQFRSNGDCFTAQESPGLLQVYVGDTTGELRKFVQLADVAVIGKSFPPYGEGQTPVEAVAYGVPVIYGGRMTNFRAICADLEQNGGSIRLKDGDSLADALKRVLTDDDLSSRMVEAASRVFEGSKGSSDRTLKMIYSHF